MRHTIIKNKYINITIFTDYNMLKNMKDFNKLYLKNIIGTYLVF